MLGGLGARLNSAMVLSICRVLCDESFLISPSSSLAGNEATHTIHGFEVNIHASGASAIGNVTSGSSKVRNVLGQRFSFSEAKGRILSGSS